MEKRFYLSYERYKRAYSRPVGMGPFFDFAAAAGWRLKLGPKLSKAAPAAAAHLEMTLVANKFLRTPPSPYIRCIQVPRGIDVADSHIVRELAAGDLVITADVPLAADVIAKGAHALNPRGEFYSTENIQERLALRNYLDELRGMGERTGGPAAPDNADRKRFADQLDRFLARQRR